MSVSAIIMAAGSGSRFGEEKQFKLLKGIALYLYSLNKFLTTFGGDSSFLISFNKLFINYSPMLIRVPLFFAPK